MLRMEGRRRMKGLQWIVAFLRDPIEALAVAFGTIRARLAPLESRIQLTLSDALRRLVRRLVLGVLAGAFALVGAGYLLMGLWLGLERFLGPIGASFVLAALFLIVSVIPLVLLNRMSREASSTDVSL
jgi:hypothetical protein